MSRAFTAFEDIFARASDMVDGSQAIVEVFSFVAELKGEKANFTFNTLDSASDMARAAVVLAVAAMDDYFTRKFAEVLVPCIRKRGVNDHLCEVLKAGGLDTRAALELLTMERPYRRIRKLASDYYSTYTAQRLDKIDSLIGTLGLRDLSKNAQKRAKRVNLLARVTSLVDRRHLIVHGGDLNKHGHLRDFDLKKEAGKMKDLRIFVENCDAIIENFVR